MAITWAERQKERGIKLELTPFPPRNCWKKYRDGKMFYFKFPLTKAGYESALLEWKTTLAKIDEKRPHAKTYHHHRDLFEAVQGWFNRFGVPESEKKLASHVDEFLKLLDDLFAEPELKQTIPFLHFTDGRKRREFYVEFIKNESGYTAFGSTEYVLPSKWEERQRQLESQPTQKKCPQTIEFWCDEYIKRAKARSRSITKPSTAKDRRNKLGHFRNYTDQSKHVSTITASTLDDYHNHVDSLQIVKESKVSYFNAFRMFVRWASKQETCDLSAPANLDDREFGFREKKGTGRKRLEKKKMLWTPEEFTTVIEKVPQPYRCYCVLMLNCGFRSSDLSNLETDDLELDEKRIVIQREKMNQNESSPVVSYLLWDKTIELIKEAMCDDPTYVFQNQRGGRLVVQKHNGDDVVAYDNLSTYWFRNREKFGLAEKRLDFIRKTGSTTIEKHNRGIETLFLGEALGSVARIHYNFNDGEPFPELDDAILHLGATFGFVKKPKKRTLKLSSDVIDSLTEKAKEQGCTVEELLADV